MRVIDTDEFIVNSWQFCFTNLGLDLSKQIRNTVDSLDGCGKSKACKMAFS